MLDGLLWAGQRSIAKKKNCIKKHLGPIDRRESDEIDRPLRSLARRLDERRVERGTLGFFYIFIILQYSYFLYNFILPP